MNQAAAAEKDDKDKKSKAQLAAGPAQELKYLLNEGTEAFAYSVTPKNLAENISTATQSRDVFELLARYGIRGGTTEADAFARRMNDRSDRLQGILNHPIVVGFGSARHKLESFTKQDDASKSTSVIRNVSFGWLIAPRSRNTSALEQIDGQYPLTAVISVPSWWRSVELNVETCWISRETILTLTRAQDEGIEICDGPRSVAHTVIRLPVSIAELSRKLGFEVFQQPYLSGENYEKTQELEIGQPGTLLLLGGRLWRSTEVVLGAQRATGITVLPNMEGIIAHFSCVLPQSGTDRQEDPPDGSGRRRITQTNVRVWTSEGVTNPPLPVDLAWPNSTPQPTQDGRKWCGMHREVFSAE
jgi:hypothetical protein